MIASLAFVFLFGLALAWLCRRIRLPRIIGMLAAGILTGPYALNLLDPALLNISADLRQIALIIILIKAGLSLNLNDLKKVGRPALLMSFLPALFEIGAFTVFGPAVLHISALEGAVIGAVLGAVSPAVVVPRMVELIDRGCGTDKQIPQMILAGASLDDVFVIVLFSAFTGMAQGNGLNAAELAGIPVSMILGILLGIAAGLLLSFLFETFHRKGDSIRQSLKVILVLGTAFLLMAAEDLLKDTVPLSGLLAVMSMACAVRSKCRKEVSDDLSGKYGRLWLGAEILLFVLVGAAVDIRYTLKAGPAVLGMIFLALLFRSLGVILCLTGTGLNRREKLYCVIAYLPKATVQAAIGSVPLAMGLPCGSLALSAAVLSILTTAPLGAAGMDLSCEKLLTRTET